VTTQDIRCVLEVTANGLETNVWMLIGGSVGNFRREGVDTDAALESEIRTRAQDTRAINASKGIPVNDRDQWFGGVYGMDVLAFAAEVDCRVVILQENFPTVNIYAPDGTMSHCELSTFTPLVTDYVIEHVWNCLHFEAWSLTRRAFEEHFAPGASTAKSHSPPNAKPVPVPISGNTMFRM
jgi:hypothetical protein